LQQVTTCRDAPDGFIAAIFEDHTGEHLLQENDRAQASHAADELIGSMRS
jgi:DNA-binding FrmR family transcriptional regulator